MPNTYVAGRSAATRRKMEIVNELFATHPETMEEAFPILHNRLLNLFKAEKLTDLAHNTLRTLRHAARKKAGLPFIGINYPDTRSDAADFRKRLKVAVEIAAEHRGDMTTDELIGALRKATGKGIAPYRARKILAKAAHTAIHAVNGARKSPSALRQRLTQYVKKTEDHAGLAPTVLAAIQLLAEAMKEDGLHTLTVSFDDNHLATYRAERETVETMNGLV
jgi:hypothetical protein